MKIQSFLAPFDSLAFYQQWTKIIRKGNLFLFEGCWISDIVKLVCINCPLKKLQVIQLVTGIVRSLQTRWFSLCFLLLINICIYSLFFFPKCKFYEFHGTDNYNNKLTFCFFVKCIFFHF